MMMNGYKDLNIFFFYRFRFYYIYFLYKEKMHEYYFELFNLNLQKSVFLHDDVIYRPTKYFAQKDWYFNPL